MANRGPATVYDRSGGGFGLKVTLPPGTTVTGASDHCNPAVWGDPQSAAHGPYACNIGYLVPAGATYDFTITVRVDQVIAGAQGTAAVDWPYGYAFDPDPGDDSAPLALN
jgi:hypothetical protein